MSGALPEVNFDWTSDDIEGLRRGYAQEREMYLEDIPPDVTIDEISVLGVGGLLFTPDEASDLAPILYFHGGGWIVGSPETHRPMCACLSAMSGRRVLSVRYRLAPENPFPAQKVDAVAALNAVLSGHVAQLGRPRSVVLAGDSAGASVALWAEAGAQPSMRAAIDHIVGFYGAFGLRDSASLRRLGPVTAGLSQQDVAAFYDHLGDSLPPDMTDTFLTRGAPLSLLVAGQDPLRDDSHMLSELMRRGGRNVHMTEVDDMTHGVFHMVGRSPEVAAWMRAGLAAITPS